MKQLKSKRKRRKKIWINMHQRRAMWYDPRWSEVHGHWRYYTPR